MTTIELLNHKINQQIRDVLLFLVLIFSFHYLYIAWERFDFYPFRALVDLLFKDASFILFNQSKCVLDHLTTFAFYTKDQTIYILSNNGQVGYVEVSPGCTSLKQWLHWVFLISLFAGPFKHKIWYIPAGIIVLHHVNLIRIVGLSISLVYLPAYFDFFHDVFFKLMFYSTIFFMWLIWVTKLKKKATNNSGLCKFRC